MIRNKLYDELEKEGYSFVRAGYNRQYIPEIFNLTDPNDWARVNTSVVVNGKYQVEQGSTASQKTLQLLQKILEETSKPDYSDYYSKALFKDGE